MSHARHAFWLPVLLLALPALLHAQPRDPGPAREPDPAAALEQRLNLLTKQLDAMQEQIKLLRDAMKDDGKARGDAAAQEEKAAQERAAKALRDAQVAQINGSLERMKDQIDTLRRNKDLTPQQLRERVKAMLKAEDSALDRTPAMPDAPQPGRGALRAPPAGASATKDLIDTAAGAGQFKIFLSLVKAAELTDTLKKDGPYTVFAPTDAAFDKMPADLLASLQAPQGKQRAVALVKNCIVADAKIRTRDIAEKKTVDALGGRQIQIVSADGKLTIGRATITQSDIEASNGVIQGMDQVPTGPGMGGPGMGGRGMGGGMGGGRGFGGGGRGQ